MLKEKFNKAKDYIKEHKVEISLAVAGTGLVIMGCKLNHKTKILNSIDIRLGKVTSVAKRSIDREIKRVIFEIDELKESISRLDDTININKFSRIPERQARIEELTIQLKELYLEKNKI